MKKTKKKRKKMEKSVYKWKEEEGKKETGDNCCILKKNGREKKRFRIEVWEGKNKSQKSGKNFEWHVKEIRQWKQSRKKKSLFPWVVVVVVGGQPRWIYKMFI